MTSVVIYKDSLSHSFPHSLIYFLFTKCPVLVSNNFLTVKGDWFKLGKNLTKTIDTSEIGSILHVFTCIMCYMCPKIIVIH